MLEISAFPRPTQARIHPDDIVDSGSSGMTLRDYFAGKALVASLSQPEHITLLGAGDVGGIKALAEDCYVMAAAMLAARGNGA